MRIKRKTMWTRSMKLISEEARHTLAIHSNNKNRLSSKYLKTGSIRVWDSKPSILTLILSSKLTTSLAKPMAGTKI